MLHVPGLVADNRANFTIVSRAQPITGGVRFNTASVIRHNGAIAADKIQLGAGGCFNAVFREVEVIFNGKTKLDNGLGGGESDDDVVSLRYGPGRPVVFRTIEYGSGARRIRPVRPDSAMLRIRNSARFSTQSKGPGA